MSLILAIDTSAGTSVALVENGNVLAEHNVHDTMKHAELIGEAIQSVLTKASVRPDQIMAVVAGRGPAPFTGLRVGIAAATLFAAGCGAKLFGAVSLDAIALAALPGLKVSSTEPLLVTTDARRKEVYWARYTNGVRVAEPAVNFPADVAGATIHADLFPDMVSLVNLPGNITEPIYLRRPDAVATADR